jgi:hypothetical protein
MSKSKYFMLLIEDIKQYWITIPVQEIAYSGWEEVIHRHHYSLEQVGSEIIFSINNVVRHRFSISERIIPPNRLRNGGFVNQDRCFVYYVVDQGKRYRFLYLNIQNGKYNIGTRKSLNARYRMTQLSRKQRNAAKIYREFVGLHA